MDRKYKAYTNRDFEKIGQVKRFLSETQRNEIGVVSKVLPFRVSNYVLDELIDWESVPNDPAFRLTFPQKQMLLPGHYEKINQAVSMGAGSHSMASLVHSIRLKLNPHPNGQRFNIPRLEGESLNGIQHKYRETVLFFPWHGQTCHAYCTFCFRWPQFTQMEGMKFAMKQVEKLIAYVKTHREVTDILVTGGDPMIMSAARLRSYLEPLLKEDLPHIRSIRIGSKSLSYWPYRYLTDPDSGDILRLFEKVVEKGKHLAFMAHFNHPVELKTKAVRSAIRRIRATGAEIRTQSPILNHINNDACIWMDLWNEQVRLGCIPYYMFVARDTGARHYFEIPLYQSYHLFKTAYENVSGLARTVRGPSMSTYFGKIQILGINQIRSEKVFTLKFLQARNREWTNRPFFAAYDSEATWLHDLLPAFGRERFFFEQRTGQSINN